MVACRADGLVKMAVAASELAHEAGAEFKAGGDGFDIGCRAFHTLLARQPDWEGNT
jgi:hypothetical protein